MLKRSAVLVGLSVCLCFGAEVASAQAMTLDIEAELASLEEAQGDAYSAARDALIARPEALVVLRLRERSAKWSASSWRRDALASVALARATDPGPFAAVTTLDGLKPAVYLNYRRARPEVVRELRKLGAAVVPAVLELYLKTFASYPFSPAEAYPASVLAEDLPRLRADEQLALQEALISVLGRSGHGSASHVIGELLFDSAQRVELRMSAARCLGDTGASWAREPLMALSRSDRADIRLRESCLVGVARLRSVGALDDLVTVMNTSAVANLRRTAATSIGQLASSWAWHARKAEGELLRARAARALSEALAATSDARFGGVATDALSIVGHGAGLERLDAILRDRGDLDGDARARLAVARDRLKVVIDRAAR